jgi:hypothetical protein
LHSLARLGERERTTTMLVKRGLLELRYQAVLQVRNEGASVGGCPAQQGLGRTVHGWLGQQRSWLR